MVGETLASKWPIDAAGAVADVDGSSKSPTGMPSTTAWTLAPGPCLSLRERQLDVVQTLGGHKRRQRPQPLGKPTNSVGFPQRQQASAQSTH